MENKTKQNKTKQNKTKQNKTKHFILIAILSIAVFSFNSCENEKLDTTNSPIISNNEITIKNGRLFFQNKESLSKIYKEYANASENKLSELLDPLYEKGFYSLRPIVTAENEELLYKHYIKSLHPRLKSSISKTAFISEDTDTALDHLDDVEEIIGDDTYAALLNTNAEIQVAEDIYKYTDVGLFIVKENAINQLENYLTTKNISQDLVFETPETVKETINLEFPQEGLTNINSDILYFRTTSSEQELTSISNERFNSKYNTNTISKSAAYEDPNYNTFLNSLGSCSPVKGLFGNLFGDNNVCIDKYESRRRVKTKAFNYNYLLVYHLGVKCVNQYRGWTGFWRVDSTDEIKLIVEAAQFEYNANALLGNNAVNNQTRERSYFMNNQKAYFVGPNNYTFNDQWNQPILSYVNQTSLPQIFQDNLTYEFFGTGWKWLDEQVQKGIDSNLKASQFNEWFYDGLYNITKSQLQTAFGYNVLPPTSRTFVAKFPENGKIIIQKTVNSQGFNIGVRESTFDWGAQLCFSASNGGSNWNVQPNTGSCDLLVKPKNFRVKIIGAIRYGNTWHGSKFNVGIN
jgi:hypothetical protein